MSSSIKVLSLESLLEQSSATEEFRAAMRQYASDGKPNDHVRHGSGCPPVKVQRVVCKLLETFPNEEISAIEFEGRSGCSDFRGSLTVKAGRVFAIDFVWDCAWRAQQEGMKTFWGDPDQQKAAQTFGYQCFQKFDEISS